MYNVFGKFVLAVMDVDYAVKSTHIEGKLL